ncbi:hypothetical protein TK78_00125 [Streptomyces sp. Tue 6075]|uniref:hypothetical protein n=1 Tax=Streptomyces sp. Tue 6075 TaxID=1661694 RepID=UPI00094A9567|nr:hypothetical protein [Streptomyces sp. Tue 6075]APS17519.1 hypothetical protein TK78_00125 [Streptomyces sp. Tue 6075]
MGRPLLPLRSALVPVMAVISGLVAGWLCWIAEGSVPRGDLAGLGAVGLAAPFFNRLLAAEAAERTGEEVRGRG